jgi:hypothetical protein
LAGWAGAAFVAAVVARRVVGVATVTGIVTGLITLVITLVFALLITTATFARAMAIVALTSAYSPVIFIAQGAIFFSLFLIAPPRRGEAVSCINA